MWLLGKIHFPVVCGWDRAGIGAVEKSGAVKRDDRQLAPDEAAEARSLGEALSTPRRGCGQLLDDACPQRSYRSDEAQDAIIPKIKLVARNACPKLS